jgi:hypothetical protein
MVQTAKRAQSWSKNHAQALLGWRREEMRMPVQLILECVLLPPLWLPWLLSLPRKLPEEKVPDLLGLGQRERGRRSSLLPILAAMTALQSLV